MEGVQFGPWYPLAEARDHSPAAEGVWQVRLASGLVDYPRGKSAMVHYGHATDVRAAALAWAAAHRGDPARGPGDDPGLGPGTGLVCRHLIEVDAATDLVAFHAKLANEFVRRFGALPRFER
jgi:hypothetical protein